MKTSQNDKTGSTRARAIELIDAFLAETGMSEREFGLKSVNDHKLVGRLRSGLGVTLTSIEKAESFMRSYSASKPDEAA